MKIDILLSTYNGEKFLREQLDSLLAQTFTNWIAYIRDDGSKDNTLEILNEYVKLYPEKFIIIENNGINLGSSKSFLYLLTQCSSDLICFCDQDDVWNSDKLNKLVEYYNGIKNKEIPLLIHSGVDVVDSSLKKLDKTSISFNVKKCGMENGFIWQVFQNDVTGCTSMVNAEMRRIIQKLDLKSIKVIQHDWFLSLIAYLNNGKYYLNENLILYRQHGNNSIGVNKMSLMKKIKIKITNGFSYPYYDQVNSLLGIIEDSDCNEILKEFVNIRKKNKISRIFWHIKNKFYREGNLAKKIYQLISC